MLKTEQWVNREDTEKGLRENISNPCSYGGGKDDVSNKVKDHYNNINP